MASFESKVSDIFDENPELARKIPALIRQIFNESETKFRMRLKNESEEIQRAQLMRLFDILFIDFFFDDLEDRFLNWVIDHYADRFSESELEEMHAQSESNLDFYEVQQVFPGDGSHIKSLFTNQEGFLKDVSSSFKLVKWDIVLTRCYLFRDDYYSTGSLTLFGPADKELIINRVREARSENKQIARDPAYADFAKNRWDIFFRIEREIRERAKNKKFYTNYGELQLCEARFLVKDIQTIFEILMSREEFNFIEAKRRKDKKRKRDITRYQFDWFTLGIEKELESIKTGDIENGIVLTTSQLDVKGKKLGIEVIGNLFVDQFLFRLETRSLDLAEFAISHFTRLFGDALAFKRIVKRNITSSPEQKISAELKKDEQSIQPPSRLIRQIEEKYYLSLLDEKIAALNNISPREARHDPSTMPLLIDWLKSLENILERNKLKGEQFFSIMKIKKELDIDW